MCIHCVDIILAECNVYVDDDLLTVDDALLIDEVRRIEWLADA